MREAPAQIAISCTAQILYRTPADGLDLFGGRRARGSEHERGGHAQYQLEPRPPRGLGDRVVRRAVTVLSGA